MQANWIGRSEGAEISFSIEGAQDQSITVFTTRPDTLAGASYVVLAPENEMVNSLTSAEQKDTVEAFRKEVARLSTIERTSDDRPKRGVPIGSHVINPLTGAVLPVWIADYVLAEYGTGAVMGCLLYTSDAADE